MKGWSTHQLGDAPLEIIDGDRGKNYPSEGELLENGDCLFLSTKNVRKHGFDFTSCQFITSEKDKLLKKGKLKINDLVLTTRGTVGNIALYNDNNKYDNIRINSGMVIIRPRIEKIYPTYLFYTFKFLQREWDLVVSGSAQPQLPIKDIKNVQLSLPPIAEQRAIAAVLSSLDDKIDLLNRQNVTLEAMAEALFRQWFVIEAKEEWEEKKLSDIIMLVGGGTPKTSITNYWGGSMPWLSGGDIACNHKKFIFSSEKYITEEGLNNSSAQLVPAYTTIITARGTIGKFCLLGIPMSFSQTNYGILPKDNKTFFFNFLLINYVINTLQASAYGSVFDTITTRLFDEINIALPSQNIIEKFESQVRLYFEKIFSNQTQIRTLEKLRDTLLPKLMSGEVRVAY